MPALAADGGVRGKVRLPRGVLIRWIDGDHVWLAERDEFSVPWLVRYRILEGAGEGR